jgi:hypothetical protein
MRNWRLIGAACGLCLLVSTGTGCTFIGDIFNPNPGQNGENGDTTDPPTDTDADGLSDTREALLGTDPADPDSDDDGLTDGQEVDTTLTDPLEFDTDGDGLSDDTEIDFDLDPLVANVNGLVDDVVCDTALRVSGVPATGDTSVFQSTASRGDFSAWRADQRVAVDDNGEIVNLDRLERISGVSLGAVDREARILTRAVNGGTIRLEDGSFWTVDIADRLEALNWQTVDTVVAVQMTGTDVWRFINRTRCTVIGVTPT